MLPLPTCVFLFIGSSFNDMPINEAVAGPLGKDLFQKEQENLLSDLKDIPKKACDRRVSYIRVFIHHVIPCSKEGYMCTVMLLILTFFRSTNS